MLDTNLALPPSMTAQRSAVVDLGSNSVRLVVFEGTGRNPVAIFNEKAVLRLGRGMLTTGVLNADAVQQALTVMNRYTAIARAMGAEPLHRGPIGQLGQHAAVHQRMRHIIGHGLVAGQVGRPLPGDDGGELVVGQPAVLRDDDVGIEFVG